MPSAKWIKNGRRLWRSVVDKLDTAGTHAPRSGPAPPPKPASAPATSAAHAQQPAQPQQQHASPLFGLMRKEAGGFMTGSSAAASFRRPEQVASKFPCWKARVHEEIACVPRLKILKSPASNTKGLKYFAATGLGLFAIMAPANQAECSPAGVGTLNALPPTSRTPFRRDLILTRLDVSKKHARQRAARAQMQAFEERSGHRLGPDLKESDMSLASLDNLSISDVKKVEKQFPTLSSALDAAAENGANDKPSSDVLSVSSDEPEMLRNMITALNEHVAFLERERAVCQQQRDNVVQFAMYQKEYYKAKVEDLYQQYANMRDSLTRTELAIEHEQQEKAVLSEQVRKQQQELHAVCEQYNRVVGGDENLKELTLVELEKLEAEHLKGLQNISRAKSRQVCARWEERAVECARKMVEMTKKHNDEIDEIRKRHYCVVCMEQDSTMLLMPCKHRVMCGECMIDMQKKSGDKLRCPMCRILVEESIETFAG